MRRVFISEVDPSPKFQNHEPILPLDMSVKKYEDVFGNETMPASL